MHCPSFDAFRRSRQAIDVLRVVPKLRYLVILIIAIAIICCQTTWSQEPGTGVAKDAYDDVIPSGAFMRLGSTRFRRHTEACIATVLPDNETLLVVGQQLTDYSLGTGRATRQKNLPFPGLNIRDATVTPDHKSVALVGFSFSQKDRAYTYIAAVLDTLTGRVKFSTKSEERLGESGLAISPDGMTVAKSGSKTRIWDVASGEEILSFAIDGIDEDAPIEFSDDGETLFIGARNTLVRWAWSSGEAPETFRLAPKTKRVVPMSFAHSEETNTLFIGADGDIIRFDLAEDKIIDSFRESPMQPLGYITDLEITPDRKQLCSVGLYNETIAAVFWDVKSGEQLNSLTGACDAFRTLSVSVDGKYVSLASRWSNLLDVYQVDTGRRLAEKYEGHRKAVNFLTFDGHNRIISAGDDRSLRVWDLQSGKTELKVEHPASDRGSSHWIRGSAVSPDGNYIATSSLDNTVRVWDGHTGEQIYQLAGHGRLGGSRCVEFSSDNKLLYSFGDDWRLYVYDLSNGKALRDEKIEVPGLQNRGDPFGNGEFLGGPCSFTFDAKQLIIDIGGSIFIDTQTGKVIKRVQPETNSGFRKTAISKDQTLLISGGLGPRTQTPLANGGMHFSAGNNHIVQLSDLAGERIIAKTQFDNSSPGPSVFAPNNSFVVVASKKRESSDGYLRVLNTENLEVIHEIQLDGSWATQVALSKDGLLLAAALHDSTILIWRLESL